MIIRYNKSIRKLEREVVFLKTIKILIGSLILILSIYLNNKIVNANNSNIEDNSNLFSNTLELEQVIDNFKIKHNVDVFVYTIESINNKNIYQEAKLFADVKFDDDNYLLFYITKEEGNVALFAGTKTQSIVNNEMISLMLTSMEIDFKALEFEKGIMTSLSNLSILIDENNRLEEENRNSHKVLNINNQKEANRNIYISMMIISVIVSIVCISLLIKNFNNNKKEAN